MKGLASASLFRAFDNFVRPSDYLQLDRGWSTDGVDWRRVRHAYKGGEYGYTIDVYVGVKAGRRPWSIAIVRESWSVGPKDEAVRASHWAHMISGARGDALAWFKAQEGIPAYANLTPRARRS